MGAVTVITSGKGGVGKSTISAGLGCALACRGKRVLLIDGDAGLRSLDAMLNIDQQVVFDIADIVNGNCEPIRAIYPCGESVGLSNNLFVLPAPSRERDVLHPKVMKRLVDILGPYYDHVLIDSPAGVGRGFASAVAAAQRALVVTTPSPVCTRDSDKVRQLLNQMGMPIQRLIINRFHKDTFYKLNQYEDLDTIIDRTGIRLIAVVPEDTALMGDIPEAVTRVMNNTIQRFFAPKNSPGALALHRLASRLEGENVPLADFQKM